MVSMMNLSDGSCPGRKTEVNIWMLPRDILHFQDDCDDCEGAS